MHECFDDIVPHPEGFDPEADLIHERAYVVRAYRKDATTMWLRGAVRDQKPGNLYIPDDDQPLTMHHMIIDLEVTMPSLEITHAKVVMEAHPNEACPRITDHYERLVGLSIARGFTHRVRELFGGPRGCTHTTALLQAMAPVAVQSTWSMRARNSRLGEGSDRSPANAEEALALSMRANLNSCHVWDEDGEIVARMRDGIGPGIPLWVRRRYAELGRDPETWSRIG